MLIDASQGVQRQSRTHAYLLRLLGERQIVVIVNKMDLVDFSAARFAEIEATYRHYLGEIDLAPAQIISIVARDGDSIVTTSTRMPRYQGPTLVNRSGSAVNRTASTGRTHDHTRPMCKIVHSPCKAGTVHTRTGGSFWCTETNTPSLVINSVVE
jgi:bifunctional enzyme CysN/CysC